MRNNVGSFDRFARVVAALGALAFAAWVGGIYAVGAGLFGGVMLFTALSGWCPLYSLAKIQTLHGDAEPETADGAP